MLSQRVSFDHAALPFPQEHWVLTGLSQTIPGIARRLGPIESPCVHGGMVGETEDSVCPATNALVSKLARLKDLFASLETSAGRVHVFTPTQAFHSFTASPTPKHGNKKYDLQMEEQQHTDPPPLPKTLGNRGETEKKETRKGNEKKDDPANP